MVHVRNHRHVTNVGLFVHDGTDLVDGEVHLRQKVLYLEVDNQQNVMLRWHTKVHSHVYTCISVTSFFLPKHTPVTSFDLAFMAAISR